MCIYFASEHGYLTNTQMYRVGYIMYVSMIKQFSLDGVQTNSFNVLPNTFSFYFQFFLSSSCAESSVRSFLNLIKNSSISKTINFIRSKIWYNNQWNKLNSLPVCVQCHIRKHRFLFKYRFSNITKYDASWKWILFWWSDKHLKEVYSFICLKSS